MRNDYTQEELHLREFMRAAAVIKGRWEERENDKHGVGDTRFLDEPLIRRDYVRVGTSKEARSSSNGTHNEHVIPRKWIYDECLALLGEETPTSIEAMGRFLQRNLLIVEISWSEQDRLNRIPKLKDGMPDGWNCQTDNPFARLKSAGIEFLLNEDLSEAEFLRRRDHLLKA